MARRDDESWAEVRARYDLREMIPEQGARVRRNRYDSDRCPFHEDRNPSFLIWPDWYECRACGERGNVVDWVAKTKGIPEREAARLLRDGVSETPAPPRRPRIVHEVAPLSPELALAYHRSLGEGERGWYHWRGISDDTIDRFRLGYGVPPGRSEGRFTIPVYEGERLVNVRYRRDDRCPSCSSPWTSEVSKGLFECLECSNTFGRIDLDDKYIGIADHNDAVLFNAASLVGAETAIICEGEFDAIILAQAGYSAVTSTSGATSFRSEWAAGFVAVPVVYAVFDSDAAGEKGLARVLELIPKARAVRLPRGMDVSEYVVMEGLDAFQGRLKAADHDPGNNLQIKISNGLMRH